MYHILRNSNCPSALRSFFKVFRKKCTVIWNNRHVST